MKPTNFAIFRFQEDGSLASEAARTGPVGEAPMEDAKRSLVGLRPGMYRIELRDNVRTISRERVRVQAAEKEEIVVYVPTQKPAPVAAPVPAPVLPPPDQGSKYPFLDGAYPGISLPLLESLYQECEADIQKHLTQTKGFRSAIDMYEKAMVAHVFEEYVARRKPNLTLYRLGRPEDVVDAVELLNWQLDQIEMHKPKKASVLPAAVPMTADEVIAKPARVVPIVSPSSMPSSPMSSFPPIFPPVSDEKPFGAPILKSLSQQRPLLLVGGIASPETTAWIRECLGGQVLWRSIHKGASSSSATPIFQQIINRKFSAVILLEELISHNVSRPLQQACKSAAIPLALGGKAGRARVRQAVAAIESVLETQQEKRARV